MLNVDLYNRLKAHSKHVRVIDKDRSSKVFYRQQPGGFVRVEIPYWGQVYEVNCPYCHDLKHRLRIEYHFGLRDPRVGSRILHVAHCHNEGCLETVQAQRDLYEDIFGGCPGPALLASTAEPEPPEPITLPLGISVDQLPADHPARQYLLARRVDIHEAAKIYGALYCESQRVGSSSLKEPRLVFPILQPAVPGQPKDEPAMLPRGLELRGWQGRVVRDVPEGDDTPRYMTGKGTKKNQLLFNLPNAMVGTGPIILVEGVFDAIAAGPNALALLGKSISDQQLLALCRFVLHRDIVVLLDRNAEEEADEVGQKIIDYRKGFKSGRTVIGSLPPGRKDPGECTREEVVRAANRSLKQK